MLPDHAYGANASQKLGLNRIPYRYRTTTLMQALAALAVT